ncbi:RNA-binding S4 domain-containing protein [Natroniella acetigena]|uniref:RNA-binding S4 domain-containing protein n=1 Tax=Natroniella acetigena TaxID=52004 RepID=UPI002009EA79|nr:RNA-binding S4 domain-containing protein [Natroniella acetigena]MCK8826834.1 RNA-binding S4 domain-containing protein [Natroniella acetigena]
MKKIKLKTETINLDQFLKWTNIVSTGGEAKLIIQAGKVMVNQEVEKKRSRVLTEGDVIQYNDHKYQITT